MPGRFSFGYGERFSIDGYRDHEILHLHQVIYENFNRMLLMMTSVECGFREAKSKDCGKVRSGFPPAGQRVLTRRAALLGRFLWEGWRGLWIGGRSPAIHGRIQAFHRKSITLCSPALN